MQDIEENLRPPQGPHQDTPVVSDGAREWLVPRPATVHPAGPDTGRNAPLPGPAGAPRAVGPGRREREYLRRLDTLGAALSEARTRADERSLRVQVLAVDLERTAAELAVAERLERGLQRHLDRLEVRAEEREQREKRLILTLGALQRENEMLRERLALADPGSRPPSRLRSPTAPDAGSPSDPFARATYCAPDPVPAQGALAAAADAAHSAPHAAARSAPIDLKAPAGEAGAGAPRLRERGARPSRADKGARRAPGSGLWDKLLRRGRHRA